MPPHCDLTRLHLLLIVILPGYICCIKRGRSTLYTRYEQQQQLISEGYGKGSPKNELDIFKQIYLTPMKRGPGLSFRSLSFRSLSRHRGPGFGTHSPTLKVEWSKPRYNMFCKSIQSYNLVWTTQCRLYGFGILFAYNKAGFSSFCLHV